jgi:hypothetical protein
MIEKITDALVALVFTVFTVFSAPAIYYVVKRGALVQVAKGLSPLTPFQRAIDLEHYSWEGITHDEEPHAKVKSPKTSYEL